MAFSACSRSFRCTIKTIQEGDSLTLFSCCCPLHDLKLDYPMGMAYVSWCQGASARADADIGTIFAFGETKIFISTYPRIAQTRLGCDCCAQQGQGIMVVLPCVHQVLVAEVECLHLRLPCWLGMQPRAPSPSRWIGHRRPRHPRPFNGMGTSMERAPFLVEGLSSST